MEYCPNGSLVNLVENARLRNMHGLPEHLCRVLFRQLLLSYKALHDQGWSHNDIKPDNAVLDSAMNLKLIDFGFADSS